MKKDVHPKIISERLGHSDIMITMNRHGHLMAGVEEKAAEALEDAGPRPRAVQQDRFSRWPRLGAFQLTKDELVEQGNRQ